MRDDVGVAADAADGAGFAEEAAAVALVVHHARVDLDGDAAVGGALDAGVDDGEPVAGSGLCGRQAASDIVSV